MNKIKRLLFIIIVVILFTLLISCNDKVEASTTTTSTSISISKETVKIFTPNNIRQIKKPDGSKLTITLSTSILPLYL